MLNLLITIILPVIILTRYSAESRLGPDKALALALALPIGYAVYEIIRSRKVSASPIIGVVSVLLTGGFRLLDIPPEWFAVKEAAIPAALALAILVSAWIGKPLARIFLDQVLDRDRIQAALAANGTEHEYEERTSIATYLLAGAFILSAILNYVLARVVVTSDPGTDAFNSELGRMTALSYPVITLPVMVVLMGTIFYILNTVGKLTGLELEDMMKKKPKKGQPAPAIVSEEAGDHVVGEQQSTRS
ncbi:MAG TPA: VC0807 family protein [Thermomicrobiales bacterium]|nr:VC0807 family protein [Thermomicrobiales bacterium]